MEELTSWNSYLSRENLFKINSLAKTPLHEFMAVECSRCYGLLVKIFIMNRYISKSYTTSKNTIDRQFTERGQL